MPLRLAFPSTETLNGARYGLATRGVKGFRMAALGDFLPPNLAGLYDLADARISNPMAPKVYVDLLKPIAAGERGELGAPDDPLYDRFAVRFLLTRLDVKLNEPWGRILADQTAALWEKSETRPLFFVAARRPAGAVLIETSEDTWISGVSHLRRRQWLGTSVYQDGGWLLMVNGELRRTDLDAEAFVTSRLPSGANQLDLLYRPAGFMWGCLIAALGMTAGVMILSPRPLRRSRPHHLSPLVPAVGPGTGRTRSTPSANGVSWAPAPLTGQHVLITGGEERPQRQDERPRRLQPS